MKTLKVLLFIITLFVVSSLNAQVSVNVNVGSPPMWGPVGYSNVQYYYLPDVEAYYDVPSSMFIYQSGGVWIHRTYLPVRYRNYDLYSGYKVVMTDYHGKHPYYHHSAYKVKYAKGYHGPAQKNIGSRPAKGHSNGKNSQFRNQSYKSSSYSKGNKSDGNKGKGNNGGHGKSNGGGHGKK